MNLFTRGDIVLVDFDPALLTEAAKIRPAVIVTNDDANELSPVLVVVPITSNTQRMYPHEVFLPKQYTGLETDSKA
ncbi:MAG: transcriptional modulator of MazE/toxin, MazF, partial [Deinococcota bacterium]